MNIKFDYDRPWQRKIGNVCLTVKLETDEYPDLSWLGEYSQYREPRHADEKLVHRASQTVLDHNGIWRDKLGRIAPAYSDDCLDCYQVSYRSGLVQWTVLDGDQSIATYEIPWSHLDALFDSLDFVPVATP